MGAHFKLVRYFSLASLVAVGVVTVLLGMFYRRIALNDLMEMAESRNVALTLAFANSLGPQFAPFVASASGLSGGELRAHPKIAKLRQAVSEQMRGIDVVKVKVYNLAGLTVFSTETGQIGEDKSDNPGFLSARSGRTVSDLVHRDTFNAFDRIIENRDLIQTYLPIRYGGPGGSIEGVFELYYDATPFLRKMGRTQRLVVIGVMLIFALLYGVFIIIVKRAEGIIKRQGRELEQYVEEIRKTNETLEQNVQKRTQELLEIKERLEGEIAERQQAEEIQKLLKELSQDITSLDIDSLLKKLTEKVCDFLQVNIADVRLLEGETWQLAGVSGVEPHQLPQSWSRSTSSRQRSMWIRENRRPLMIPDITEGPIKSLGHVLESLGIRGFLGVPIFSRSGEVIGILRALTYNPRHFTQEEVDLLQQMANGAGIALENAQLLEQTKKQAFELEKANKVKDEFLGFVSHELRTPVNAVVGYAGMVRDGMFGEVSVEQGRVLGKILARSRDLLEMMNGLLEATRIEAGAVKVKTDEIRLCRFLDELRSSYEAPLNKGLTLAWDYPSDLPVVKTDGGKLRHILQNLINNAIKYTDKGTVSISARIKEGSRLRQRRISLRLKQAEGKASGVRDQGLGDSTGSRSPTPDPRMIEFKVVDTGVGIPKETLPLIFEMFRQVEGSRGGHRGGVGLGLHIVERFTEMLGGEIGVESEPGKGSTFTVTIPCESYQSAASGVLERVH